MHTVRVAPVRLCSCSGGNILLESPLPKWQRFCVNGGQRANKLFLERAWSLICPVPEVPPQPNPTQQVSNADCKRCSYFYAQEIGLLKYRSNQVFLPITLIRPQVAICFSSLHCSSPLLLHIFSAVVLIRKHKIFDFLNGPCGKDLHICQLKTSTSLVVRQLTLKTCSFQKTSAIMVPLHPPR